MTPPCRVVRPKVSPPPRPTTTRNSTVTGVTAPFTRMTPSCLRNLPPEVDLRLSAPLPASLPVCPPPTRSQPSPVCTLAKPASPLSVCPPPPLYFPPTLVPEVDLRLSAPKVACWNPHRQVCLPLRIHT